MIKLLPVILTLLAGIGVAVQPPTNAALARVSGSVLLAATISLAVGTAVLAGIWLAIDRTPMAAVRTASPWLWLGGLYGAYFVAAVTFAAPRLGLSSMLTLVVASQLVTALLLDHYGLLGLSRDPASPARIAGVALVIVGVVLVRRG